MFTQYGDNLITLTQPRGVSQVCRLLAGRAWMVPLSALGDKNASAGGALPTNGALSTDGNFTGGVLCADGVPPADGTLSADGALPAHDTPLDMTGVAARLRALRDAAAGQFVARGEMAEAVAVALAAGEHVFVYGPPGTAKSSLLRLFAEGIGGRFWRIVLNPDITREDIVGPLDPAALKQGEWRRRWAGLATADIVFLDEVWNSSPQVANILLDGLEERRVTAGEDERAIPLLSAMAASNETPGVKETQAAYDRFLFRLSVGYLRDPDDFRALMTVGAGATIVAPGVAPGQANVPLIHAIRLMAATAEAMAINPPPDVVDTLAELWRQVGHNGRAARPAGGQASDRRWRKTLKAACAAALLESAPLSPRHLGVARWTLWAEPDEETDIRNLVLGLTDPVASDVLDAEALLADLKNAGAGLDGMNLQERAEIAGKARKLMARCDKLMADPSAKPYQARLAAAKAESNMMVSRVLDLMAV